MSVRHGPRVAIDGRVVADPYPGIGRYVHGLLGALAHSPERPEIRVLTDLDSSGGRLQLDAIFEESDIRRIPIDAPVRSLRSQWRVPSALREAGADLFHATYWITAYRPGVRMVLSLYDVIGLHPEGGLAPTRRLILRLGTRLAVRAATRVITLSAFSARDVAKHAGVDPGRIDVTPLGVGPAFRPIAAEAVAAARRRWRIPERYGLYVGSNKPHKNLSTLVRAWSGLAARVDEPAPPLVVAGPWDARYDAPRRLATELRVDVRFPGALTDADLPAVYSGAAVFAFPSRYEGFGLPPLEAMACGAPVVVAGTTSLPEVVGEGGLLVDPDDVGAWVEALGRVLSDPQLAAKLRGRGLARAARFPWSRTAETTLASYQLALGARE